jgi:hypothetical protein
MKQHRLLAALALTGTLCLTGCVGSEPASAPTATTSATSSATTTPVSPPSSAPVVKSTPTPTPTEDSEKSIRGNVLMEVGVTGIISSKATKKVTTTFIINAITPGTCDQPYSQPAVNGQIMLVDISVETTPELAESSYPSFTLSGYDFKFIADSGTTFNGYLSTGATYGCIANSETFPSGGMGPAEKITAKVVLDVPAAHGILVLKAGLSAGFEYKF